MNPRTLKPYFKAYELRRKETDREQYCQGMYFFEAVSVALANAFKGKNKPVIKYRDKPFFDSVEEELTEENYEQKLRQALLNEELWIKASRDKGLPETIINK